MVRDLAGFKQGTHSYRRGRNIVVQGAFTLVEKATVLELGADIWTTVAYTGATPLVVRSLPSPGPTRRARAPLFPSCV
jgi:hypothetical protein